MLKQRIYGVIILLICAVIMVLASQGTTMEERDCTAILFLIPLGEHLLLTKQLVVYDFTHRQGQEVTADEHRE